MGLAVGVIVAVAVGGCVGRGVAVFVGAVTEAGIRVAVGTSVGTEVRVGSIVAEEADAWEGVAAAESLPGPSRFATRTRYPTVTVKISTSMATHRQSPDRDRRPRGRNPAGSFSKDLVGKRRRYGGG